MTPQEIAKQRAEVLIAFAEGKRIQSMRFANNVIEWIDISEPLWDWSRVNYRIKPEEPKKVTLLGYVDEFKYSRFAPAEFKAPTQWTRVPSIDLEYEVTE